MGQKTPRSHRYSDGRQMFKVLTATKFKPRQYRKGWKTDQQRLMGRQVDRETDGHRWMDRQMDWHWDWWTDRTDGLIDKRTDRHTDRCMDKGTDGQTDKTDGWTKGLMDRQQLDKQKVMDTDIRHSQWTDGQTNGQRVRQTNWQTDMDGQMNRQMDKQTKRQTDKWTEKQTNGQTEWTERLTDLVNYRATWQGLLWWGPAYLERTFDCRESCSGPTHPVTEKCTQQVTKMTHTLRTTLISQTVWSKQKHCLAMT